ncbi:MAG: hypothetical protein JOZ60_06855 [Verrucomicrobia bacterium]|nr:hypothetical protein [Verrucomicrobiota bacterium]
MNASATLSCCAKGYQGRSPWLVGASAARSMVSRRAFGADTPTTWSIYSVTLANRYEATWDKGGRAFANSIGAEYITLVHEGDSEKGMADLAGRV